MVFVGAYDEKARTLTSRAKLDANRENNHILNYINIYCSQFSQIKYNYHAAKLQEEERGRPTKVPILP